MSEYRNMLGALFSPQRIERAPELSTYTVDHTALDEWAHDDLAARSKMFREALTKSPTIETPDGRQEMVAAKSANSDIFFTLHDGRDHPRVKPANEVKPSREAVRQVMEGFQRHPELQAARAYTRGDPEASAFCLRAVQGTFWESMTDVLQEQLKRSEQMAQAEQAMQQAQEQAQDPNASAADRSDATGRAQAAQGALQALADAQAASGAAAIAGAAQAAAQGAKEAAKFWVGLPGNGAGERQTMAPDETIALAEKMLKDPRVREVFAGLGRMERDFRFKRSTHTTSGRETPIGVELGDDLRKMTASTVMELGTPVLRGLWAQKFTAKRLLQYETMGEAESGKGPFELLIDLSESMFVHARAESKRHIWAKTVALGLASLASIERRPMVVIGFTTRVIGEWHFPPGKPNLKGAYEIATLGNTRGGTEPFEALQRAYDILTTVPAFKQADVVIVTDGECRFSDLDSSLREDLKDMGVRIHGVSIERDSTRYLEAMCDYTIPVRELQGPSAATDSLVQAVMV